MSHSSCVDPSKNLLLITCMLSFQTKELLSLFLTSEEISKGFDPLAVLYDSDNDDRETMLSKKILNMIL
jgi:hypothetical protein